MLEMIATFQFMPRIVLCLLKAAVHGVELCAATELSIYSFLTRLLSGTFRVKKGPNIRLLCPEFLLKNGLLIRFRFRVKKWWKFHPINQWKAEKFPSISPGNFRTGETGTIPCVEFPGFKWFFKTFAQVVRHPVYNTCVHLCTTNMHHLLISSETLKHLHKAPPFK